jgi:UDP:flavonoid glycosyltransferase YjiC (YdhE family)
MRWVPYTGTAPLPDWLVRPAPRPRICLTLGTSRRQFFDHSGGLRINDLLSKLGKLDVEFVATLNENQLAAVEQRPANFRFIEYVPLNSLLPTCAGIIHHGGGCTYAAAVAHRTPQIIAARSAGQTADFARFVSDSRAGFSVPDIDSPDFSADLLAQQVTQLVDDQSFATCAEQVYRDSLAQPSPRDLVDELEDLTIRYRR